MDKITKELIECLEMAIRYAGNEGSLYERFNNQPDLGRWRRAISNAKKITPMQQEQNGS